FAPVASAQGVLILESGITAPNSGTFNFRVINVAAGIGAVDVYLTVAGADLNSTSPNLANVGVGAISGLVAVNTGNYELRVTAAGTKDVIYDTASAGSHSFAVQATATPGANLLTLAATLASATDTSLAFSGPAGALVPLVLNDNNLPPPAGRARVRFVNVSPGLGPLDVYVN